MLQKFIFYGEGTADTSEWWHTKRSKDQRSRALGTKI